MFPGVKNLLPAHLALFSPEGFTTRHYWSLRYEPKIGFSDEREFCDEIVEWLREAVRLRMISDVPLGAFLSVPRSQNRMGPFAFAPVCAGDSDGGEEPATLDRCQRPPRQGDLNDPKAFDGP